MPSTVLGCLGVSFGVTGCLAGNDVSGHWRVSASDGCNPGDDVYVAEKHGDGVDVADHFACDGGGFVLSVPSALHQFNLELVVTHNDRFAGIAYVKLDGVDGDRDIGLVVFGTE